jgi:class 3 adenylate cyclase
LLCSGEVEHVTTQQPLASPAQFAIARPHGGQHPDLSVVAGGAAQRKFVTVLFADIKGSMGLSRAIALEQWWSVIAGLFDVMCESVDRFDGWVANFTGDGILAVFEPLGAAEEHAHRACQAALWLRNAIRKPTEDVRDEHGLELSIRVGINTGEALTGTIGRRFSRYHTAAGYAVALARRMESLAPPGRIYLTEDTAALLGPAVELRELGAFEIRGAHCPLGVFELLENGRRW